MNNRKREKTLFIVLASIAAAAALCFLSIAAICFAGLESGKHLLSVGVVLWCGIVSSAILFSIGATFLIRLSKK